MTERQSWYVYMVQCADGTLYTGITNDLARRVQIHNDGTGAKYTHSRRPVKLVYSEIASSKSDALRLEIHIKSLSRNQKLALIAEQTQPAK